MSLLDLEFNSALNGDIFIRPIYFWKKVLYELSFRRASFTPISFGLTKAYTLIKVDGQ